MNIYRKYELEAPFRSAELSTPVLNFAERIQAATGLEATWEAVNECFADNGIDFAVYMFMRPSAPQDDALIRSNLPSWWTDYYLDRERARHDPFFKTCKTFGLMRTGVEFIDDHTGVLNDQERAFIREASETGLRCGISSPVRLENPGRYGGWNLGNAMPRPEFERYIAVYRERLQLMGFIAHEAMQSKAAISTRARRRDVSGDGGARLSSRERECLLWLARGQRNAQIAERLNIATVTVELHFRRLRAKLGSATREEALVKAIMSGEIVP